MVNVWWEIMAYALVHLRAGFSKPFASQKTCV
uniref:Uncharacterized protein n=1 Tax=Arundo donax TaxID=35708 RepID=A0A0A9BZX5_ARUDO